MQISFDFHLPRYLAQRFPILRRDSEGGFSSDFPNATYRWPQEEQPGWELDPADSAQLRLALEAMPQPVELMPDATVADALAALDQWLVPHLRKTLPARVQELLTRSLQEHWGLYSEVTLSDDYLWRFLSTSSVGESQISGKSVCIPPLVGRVVVFAYHECCDNPEDGCRKVWLNDECEAHLCDRLSDVFTLSEPKRDPEGNVVPGPDGGVIWEDVLAEPAALLVEYRLGSVARGWLDEMAGFGFWPGAIPPSEHWFLRRMEVEASRAEHTISFTVPSTLARSVSEKCPQVYSTLARVAATVADEQTTLLPPVWMDNTRLVATWKWAFDKAFPQRMPTGKRRYSLRGASFMAGDRPDERRRCAAIRELSRRVAGQAGAETAPDGSHFGLSRWEIARQFAADVATAKEELSFDLQHGLFELHRMVAGAFETIARQRFMEEGFSPTESRRGREEPVRGISQLFWRWLRCTYPAAQKGDWENKLYKQVVEPCLVEPAALSHQAPDLFKLLRAIPEKLAAACKGSALPQVGRAIAESVACGGGTAGWRSCLVPFAASAPGDTAAAASLAVRILVELRNTLAHGTISECQQGDATVTVVNHAEEFHATLSVQSLAVCYRLLIIAMAALHNQGRPDFKLGLWSWLWHYADADRDVAVVPPRIYWRGAPSEAALCLCTQRTATMLEQNDGPTGSEPDATPVAPELAVELAGSIAGVNVAMTRERYRSLGVRELLLLVPSEATCYWWVLAPDGDEQLNPDADGVLASRVFPNLHLSTRSFFRNARGTVGR